jgi:2-C-methyl-D-erythritol 4-phosphate cytidylyltransferase
MKAKVQERVCLIVLAAGKGVRFGAPLPKQFTHVDGVPLLTYAIQHVASPLSTVLSHLVVVVPSAHMVEAEGMVPAEFRSRSTVIAGGSTRTASLRSALDHVHKTPCAHEWIVVHDGVRPQVSSRDVAGMWRVCRKGAVDVLMLSQPVKEALLLKQKRGRVRGVHRDDFLVAQTPYFINAATASHMYQVLRKKRVHPSTDMSELCGSKRGVVISHYPASTANTKLTYAHDLLVVSDALRHKDTWV